MWERIEMELNNVNVENLGFDHLICSGVLNIKSESFTNISGSFCNIFKEPFQKYKLDQNHVILDTCKDFIQKKESKINEDEDLGNIDYRKWIDHLKKLKKITKQMLELLEEGSSASAIQKDSHKIARRADYMVVVQLGKNAELEVVYLETGRPNSTQDKQLHDHKKLIRFSKNSNNTTKNVLKL
ncbi:hypothetical protein RhiirC2_713430 [Rhizophagus irregularis]|uniref:Uncharacterized protein n=1 Tax=Rhizophagus irregularis TaxID=588596 RepID=A0A2N1N391_9GLOM|nr:hypothetical protein RhiirC2_713430 [Rhizophagus irregularis]